MMKCWSSAKPLAWMTSVGLIAFSGCAIFHPSSLSPTGLIVRTHAKPIDNGFNTDWDPMAVKVTLDRVEKTSPIGNMEVYVATVLDKDGKMLAGRRVEWVIAKGGVGDILEVDESGLSDSRGYKVSNHYAVSHTNNFDHLLDRGTDDPSDDILIHAGQTWCVVTSPVEGKTHLFAYAPAIYNWSDHMAMATQNWFDVAWDAPTASMDPAGTSRVLNTRVYRYSDGSPLVDYLVRYELLNGPDGYFESGQGNVVYTRTNAEGVASAKLFQDEPVEGTNDIKVTVIRPGDEQCCKPEVNVANGMTRATWVLPGSNVAQAADTIDETPYNDNRSTTFPAARRQSLDQKLSLTMQTTPQATPCDPVEFKISVHNDGNFPMTNVKIVDEIPDGLLVYGGKSSHVYNIGTLQPGEAKLVSFQADPQRSGTFISRAVATGSGGQRTEATSETNIEQPRLMITKYGPDHRYLGKEATFDLTVTNTGDTTVWDTTVVDTIPEGMSFVSAGQGGQFANGKVVWRIDSLEPGASTTVSHTLQSNNAGLARSTAWASTRCAEASATSETDITGLGALKMEVFDTEDPIQVGETTSYEIRVTNQGSAPITSIRIHCKLADGQGFVKGEGPTEATQSGNQVTFAPLPNLAPQQQAFFRVFVKSLKTGDVRFKAAMTSDQLPEPVFETESTNMY